MEYSKPTPPETAVKHFEFPEVVKSTSNSAISRPPKSEQFSENNMKSFEPKVASTPTAKYEKMDFGESEANAIKSSSIIDANKVGESKISPTNSVVRAMIYTNKNKSGNKKKNTLVASKY